MLQMSTLKEIRKVYWQEIWKWKRPPKIKNIIMDDKKINHQRKEII